MNKDIVIQCLWIGGSLSRMEKLSIRSFLRNSHTIHLYTYEYIEDVPSGVILMDANQIIPADKIFKYRGYDSYAGFANLFRYKLLMEKGGFWSDLDIVCLKPIVANEKYVFASEKLPNDGYQVNNCFIGAPKNSDVMHFCYSTAVNKKHDELRWGETGPKLLTEAVVKFGLVDYVVDSNVICPIDYWNCQYFVSRSIKDLITEDSYTVHLWNEMWRRNMMDKSVVYSDNCIYEELHGMYPD